MLYAATLINCLTYLMTFCHYYILLGIKFQLPYIHRQYVVAVNIGNSGTRLLRCKQLLGVCCGGSVFSALKWEQ